MTKLRELDNELECLRMQLKNIEDKMKSNGNIDRTRWYKEYLMMKEKIHAVEMKREKEIMDNSALANAAIVEEQQRQKDLEPKIVLIKGEEEEQKNWFKKLWSD
jgi:hypothetical protein